MELPSWLPAMLVSLTHLLWISGSWFVGHFIYLIFHGCTDEIVKECSVLNFAAEDWFGIIILVMGSTLYFRIAQHVINALYKGELPIQNAMNIFGSFVRSQGNGRNRKKGQKRK